MAEVKKEQRYVEHEGLAFRGPPGGWPMTEVMVDGKWTPAGKMAHDAALYGRPIDESEAAEYGGAETEGGSKD